jgi:predicted enzyme related to lactoylglutathione lyase
VEDIERVYRQAKASGARFHCAPLDFGGEARATYGRDPDGNIFELWENP